MHAESPSDCVRRRMGDRRWAMGELNQEADCRGWFRPKPDSSCLAVSYHQQEYYHPALLPDYGSSAVSLADTA